MKQAAHIEAGKEAGSVAAVPAPGRRRVTWGRQIAECVGALVVALSTYLLTTTFVMQTVVVDGESMKPTLRDSQRLMLNRVEYLFREPQWGDIVVLKDPEDGGLSIKRVIAAEGQTVELTGGAVIVDGMRLKETYLPKGTRTFSYRVYDHEQSRCGRGEYYVLGDNRGCSADSRVYGLVPRANILGVVVP
jgi:signal peptidase I